MILNLHSIYNLYIFCKLEGQIKLIKGSVPDVVGLPPYLESAELLPLKSQMMY